LIPLDPIFPVRLWHKTCLATDLLYATLPPALGGFSLGIAPGFHPRPHRFSYWYLLVQHFLPDYCTVWKRMPPKPPKKTCKPINFRHNVLEIQTNLYIYIYIKKKSMKTRSVAEHSASNNNMHYIHLVFCTTNLFSCV
jgi:hypothetical protein